MAGAGATPAGAGSARLENVMKSSTKNGAKNNLHKVKEKPEKRWQKLMKDPTLEGKDENKVGRIPEKVVYVD